MLNRVSSVGIYSSNMCPSFPRLNYSYRETRYAIRSSSQSKTLGAIYLLFLSWPKSKKSPLRPLWSLQYQNKKRRKEMEKVSLSLSLPSLNSYHHKRHRCPVIWTSVLSILSKVFHILVSYWRCTKISIMRSIHSKRFVYFSTNVSTHCHYFWQTWRGFGLDLL